MGLLPAAELLRLISLQIPLLLGYLLPLALYLGILLTFGRMYLDSEMTVLSACGGSRPQLTAMVFAVALFIASIVAWLMAVVVPKAQGDVNQILNRAAVTASVEQIIPGRFIVFGKPHHHIIFYAVNSENNHTLLQHVFMAKSAHDSAKSPDENTWDVIVAQSAFEEALAAQKNTHYLILKNGYRYSGVPGESTYRVMQFDQYGIRLVVNEVPTPNVEQCYSMSKLWSMRLQSADAVAELQWRIAMPISTLIF